MLVLIKSLFYKREKMRLGHDIKDRPKVWSDLWADKLYWVKGDGVKNDFTQNFHDVILGC